MTEILSQDEWGIIRKISGLHLVFDQTCSFETEQSENIIGLQDFHDSADLIDTSKAVGSRVFKKLSITLADNASPFDLISLSKVDNGGHGICTTYGYTGVKLNNFYIKSQSLYEYHNSISNIELKQYYGMIGSKIIENVLFDTPEYTL